MSLEVALVDAEVRKNLVKRFVTSVLYSRITP